MKRWGSWGGDFSIKAMVKKAGIPGSLYAIVYATESRGPQVTWADSNLYRPRGRGSGAGR